MIDKPTIRDVALKAAVSRSTVSRVLNGSSLVSDTARQAVLDAVASLSYVPDEHARSLGRRNPQQGSATAAVHNAPVERAYVRND